MTRPKNPEATDKEAQLQEATTAVLNKEHTCHSAAVAFNVPHQTLYYSVKGTRKACNQGHEHNQILTCVEEKELVWWIILLTISGYPPRYATL
jgi:helix-turn-helix, Psq domain